MIDQQGYRENVGIILCNQVGELFWARRIRQTSWQFPQGGIKSDETPEQAMYRELHEEIGLHPEHVRILARTDDWLYYDLPEHLINPRSTPRCIGQKQIWFLLLLEADSTSIDLRANKTPEFDGWRWVDQQLPIDEVIYFKSEVYQKAIAQLSPSLPKA